MNELLPWPVLAGIGLLVAAVTLFAARRRLRLSRAKHRSIRGHARMARRLARLIPAYSFDQDRFFRADGAEPGIESRRISGFESLAIRFRARSPRSIELLAGLRGGLSDLRFTGRYRVPFPFSAIASETLQSGIVVDQSSRTRLTDLDGNEFIDLSGAYGVNVFGTDFYKTCIDIGRNRASALGPVLGPYHPSVVRNVQRLKRISGLDEVSFHMSGTEAVMQAVRLARYHTRRSHIVRFCGAYHGWWDDVQPGVGNPSSPGNVHTLADMSEATLKVLATRRDIACVLVNPLQALHPNGNAPSDGALMTGMRTARCDIEAYRDWLRRLREVCTQAGLVLILDEIFVGFRIAPGGAQEYFGIKADLVTYGKTLGGGLPVGVLCGRADLMRRFREDRPLDICFARGTFNAHPYVMTTMDAFLERFESHDIQRHYQDLDARWRERAMRLNRALNAAGLPIRVVQFSSIFVVLFTRPGRYNWMLQYYLNDAGLLLPWVGTGRMIFSINFPENEFDEVTRRFIAAGEKMKHDGWWSGPELSTNAIGRMMLLEMLGAKFRS